MAQESLRKRSNTIAGSSDTANHPPHRGHRPRRSTNEAWSLAPAISPIEKPEVSLPFRFGVEFELQLRARTSSRIVSPESGASVSAKRRFNLNLLGDIASILSERGMTARGYDAAEGGEMDFTVWTVMLDGSLSKSHMDEGFYPVEIVTPILVGDESWPGIIDKFWIVLLENFEVRLDASAGTHIHISCSRQQIVDIMCPNREKYFAWNLLPSGDGGSGSVEFRRPPPVATAKKAKHWIAFTMSFVHMALRASPETLAAKIAEAERWGDVSHPDFQEDILKSARELGIDFQLDVRLCQEDDVQRLHFTMINEAARTWLQSLNLGYKFTNLPKSLCSTR
ncbi:hypothetical protein F5Y16DRAFT_413188 [Xylariaceae sp. FL0255]|nr:hypothetical protein F5Y16DRAFT_413188 [Xylariaceae sp. FL0255]